jgi:cytosine/uracil/thiamine/allantoin permease
MRAINYNTLTKKLFSNFVFSNLPIIIALIILAYVPFLILQDENEIANQITSYSFYLLIMGVIWKSIEYIMGQHPPENSTSTEKLESQI